jgi:hypothetical protein
MKLAFRPADLSDDEDRQFVIATWSSSFKHANSAGLIASEDWSTVMHPQFAKVLARRDARTIVAYERTDPTFFYGWVAGDTTDIYPPYVFYAYVKEPFRRLGVARALFDRLGVDLFAPLAYACHTPAAAAMRDAGKIPRARHKPLVARFPKEQRNRSKETQDG